MKIKIKQVIHRIIIIALFSFICNLNVFSQKCELIGKLIDYESGEPIAYANAILTSQKDSTFLQGSITDEYGAFLINDVQSGNYDLKFSFIGYQTVQMNNILIQRGTRDVGEIKLNVLAENLEAVTIRATRSAITYKVDKKVINASSFPGANVAMDLLENIPSLQVDFEGKLTYRGDGTFKVFINGHPVANGEEKLRQIPADKIDKIEVITNPSAKYDAEGTAGIIQVILKRNRLQGYAINTSAKASTLGTYEWLFSVDQKGDRGGWYVEGQLANYIWNKMSVTEEQTITQGNTVYQTNSVLNVKRGGKPNYVEFGFNYDLTNKDYIDFSLYVNPLKSTNNNISSGKVSDLEFLSSNLIQENSYFLKSEYDLFYRYLGATLTYDHAFSKDRSHLLSVYIDYSTYLHPLEEKQIDGKEYATYTDRLGFKGKEYNEMFFETNIGYQNKLSELSSFEAGAEVSLDHIPKVTSISGVFDNAGNIIPFPNEPEKQEVDFIQDIYSAYITFKSGWNKFEYQLGLRIELTDRKSNYSYIASDDTRIFIPVEKQFTDLFPSIHTVYSFSETHQLAANFSRRIDRPDYWSLVPLSQYSTPYVYYTGNGNLMPAYSNAYEMAYKKSWDKNFIGAEIFARNTQNVIQSYLRTDTTNILVESPENIGSSWSIGFELMAGVDLFAWWNVNLSTSLYSYQLFVDIDNMNKTESQIRSDSRMNNTFMLPKTFTIKWDLNYRSPEVTAQTKRDGYFYSNLAIKKGFNDNQWQLTVSCSNIFNSKKYTSRNKGTDFYIESDYVIDPFVSFKISYGFDNQE